MDWILEHLKILIFAASALAYWVNQRKAAKDAASRTPPSQKNPPTRSTADNDERVRRVQEEIRRRIQERTQGRPVVVNQPIPSPVSELRRIPPPVQTPIGRPAPSPVASRREEEILERQRKMAEEFRLLEAKRAQMARAEGNVVETGRLRSEAGWRAAEAKLITELKNPESLRRAIILREVLGPPLSLRK